MANDNLKERSEYIRERALKIHSETFDNKVKAATLQVLATVYLADSIRSLNVVTEPPQKKHYKDEFLQFTRDFFRGFR